MFVPFNQPVGPVVYVNATLVTCVKECMGNTVVHFDAGNSITVKDTASQVVRALGAAIRSS